MENKYLFKAAMAVMVRCQKKYPHITDSWSRDIQFIQLAYHIYQKVGNLSFDENQIEDSLHVIFHSVDEYMEEHRLVNTDFKCKSLDLPYPPANKETDCLLGITAGQFLGIPTPKAMNRVNSVLKEYEEHTEFYSLGELIQELHPDWLT